MPLRRAVPWLAGYVAVLVAAAAPRLVDDVGLGRPAGLGDGGGRHHRGRRQ